MNGSIAFDGVRFEYPGRPEPVADLSLRIAAGELVVLTGPSGSGKTTLTRLVNGLLPHFHPGRLTGRILLDGRDLAELENWERGRSIGSVFQDPRSQFFSNEVAGEIAFGCENYGLPHREIVERVHETAGALRLEGILGRALRGLSYGMRQRVAIASARAVDPRVYVLDEPSANLDLDSTEDLHELLRGLKERGRTVIVAEHRLHHLMDLADRIVCLREGRIETEFTADEFVALPEQRLVEMGLRMPSLEALRPRPCERPEPPAAASPIVEAVGLRRRYGRTRALDGVDLRLLPGQITALVGPNGAGKSVLGRTLAGLVRPDSGEVRLRGGPARSSRRRHEVWYIGQDLDSQLFGESVLDELLTGRRHRDRLHGRATGILRELGLDGLAEQHPSTLSGGQKQRLVLGAALMDEAPVLILDEPTSGLDGRTMRSVSALLRRLAGQGRTVVLITHDVECALECCTRVVRMEAGRITDDTALRSVGQLLALAGRRAAPGPEPERGPGR